jgi:hypothetical protein
MIDDKAELWKVYQVLQAALRGGSSSALRGAAQAVVERLGNQFVGRISGKSESPKGPGPST